jgi:hypothetical protein
MNFTQLVSVLEREALFFSSARNFDDPLEGSVTPVNVDARQRQMEEDDLSSDFHERISGANEMFTYFTFINCWHMNRYESAAMWDQYSRIDNGIAIQTTTDKLESSLGISQDAESNGNVPVQSEGDKGLRMNGGEITETTPVTYIDYEQNGVPQGNILAPFAFKRRSYEHEQELRAMISDPPIVELTIDEALERDVIDNEDDVDGDNYSFTPINFREYDISPEPGRYVQVNTQELIENVYVSPDAPEWFFELVGSIVENYDIPSDIVVKSSLHDDPFY